MGCRSFNAWPSVEAILNSIGDGRSAWRHKTLPMVVTPAERHGQPVVGRAWKSKSLYVNEAIMHYYRKDEEGFSCADIRQNIQALQDRLTQAHEEIDRLQRRRWWQR